MKSSLFFVIILSIITASASLVYASQDTSLEAAVSAFVAALKAGDIDALETMTDGKLLKRFVKMKNSTPNYRSFLIRRYKDMTLEGTTFQNLTNDEAMALVKVSFDKAAVELFKWTLARSADGKWRIVDEGH